MKSTKFTWLGHATVRVDLPGGEVMAIDPWLEGNPNAAIAASAIDRLDPHLRDFGSPIEVVELAPGESFEP